MKHLQIVEIAERLINNNQRESAKSELAQIIMGAHLPEIEKVQVLSVVEMHLLSKCNLISNCLDVLIFICRLKEEIKTPHLAKFIKEYMCLQNNKFTCSPYVERKLQGLGVATSANKNQKQAVKVA